MRESRWPPSSPSKQCLPLFMVLLFIGAIGCLACLAGTSQDGGTAEDAGVDLFLPRNRRAVSTVGAGNFQVFKETRCAQSGAAQAKKWAVGDAGTALHFQGGSSGSW